MRVQLELEGYTVREAGSAEEGLAALEEQSPDLILLDVMMPQVDGWEMLRRVQERHGVGSIPVIMFSGKVDDSGDAASPRRAGLPRQAVQPAAADRLDETAAPRPSRIARSRPPARAVGGAPPRRRPARPRLRLADAVRAARPPVARRSASSSRSCAGGRQLLLPLVAADLLADLISDADQSADRPAAAAGAVPRATSADRAAERLLVPVRSRGDELCVRDRPRPPTSRGSLRSGSCSRRRSPSRASTSASTTRST